MRDTSRNAPEIKLKQYLVYVTQTGDFDPMTYVDNSSDDAEYGAVTAYMPEEGLRRGVNQVTYSRTSIMGQTGTTTLYVIVE